jgi:predicted secreted acid phosphatase
MKRAVLVCLMSLAVLVEVHAAELRIGTWNVANLHHEDNVALRAGAQARDAQDFDRLKAFAGSLKLDIVALQEIGSPRALARIFPEDEYHLMMSERYIPGDEDRKASERDIFTAFAVRKSRFPKRPQIETLTALSLVQIGFDRDGTPSKRPTRAGMVLNLKLGSRTVSILNVHMKSGCNSNSLAPVFDAQANGTVNKNRYDCRTLAAQSQILENWIEQQAQIGRSMIVLGDFNRRLNALHGAQDRADHVWEMVNDGGPNGLTLRKGPTDRNTACWPEPHPLFHADHIDFIVFDSSLDNELKLERITKLGLPHQDDDKYAKEGGRLSDHCPVVAILDTGNDVPSLPEAFKKSTALKWMQESAEYRALALATFAAARQRVEDIARNRRLDDAPWVVVMDADETILDNTQFQLEMQQRDLHYTRELWRAWVERRDAGAVPGAVAFFARVLALGGKIAIVTNRDADQLAATAENLRKLGFSTDAANVCVLGRPPKATFETPPYGNNKDARRLALREGKASACWDDKPDPDALRSWAQPQDLVMYVGDNVQDFPGVTQKAATAVPRLVSEHLGQDWFLLPNPIYGSW